MCRAPSVLPSCFRVSMVALAAGLAIMVHLGSGPVSAQSLYRLGPNDVLQIKVFGEADLTLETKVAGDGTINFPLLGRLEVEGKSLPELQEDLTTKLASGYLRKPRVTVAIAKHRNFYVTGEVRNPGGFPFEEGLTVQKALAIAGGMTDKAQRTDLHALRKTNGQEARLPVQMDLPLLPDDILVVPERQRIHVGGEVKAPGQFAFEPGLTVQKALSMAGGITEKGERSTAKLTRVEQGIPLTREVPMDETLQPNDFVVAPPMRKIYVNGEVKKAGDYPYERGLTVHKLITLAGGFTDRAATGKTKVLRSIHGVEESVSVNLDTVLLPEDIVVVPRSFF